MPSMDVGTPPKTPSVQGGCYRIQVLVVSRQKRWRDAISKQVRNMIFQATACDRGVDAMTVLVLGLPVDILVVDVSLQGGLCCAQLVVEARALRPALRIVLASDPFNELAHAASSLVPDILLVGQDGFADGMVANTVREALAGRAA